MKLSSPELFWQAQAPLEEGVLIRQFDQFDQFDQGVVHLQHGDQGQDLMHPSPPLHHEKGGWMCTAHKLYTGFLLCTTVQW